jgi:hypothetical protein
MDSKSRQALVEKYRDGYRVVSDALRGISDRELDARAAPGRWSVREIVHHLADSEMTSAIRLRRLIAEGRPMIQGYDRTVTRQPGAPTAPSRRNRTSFLTSVTPAT